MGLMDVDFEKTKFITIMVDGKLLIESGKVSTPRHIRIEITPDFSTKLISEDKAEKLK
jgi:hypothetical protein